MKFLVIGYLIYRIGQLVLWPLLKRTLGNQKRSKKSALLHQQTPPEKSHAPAVAPARAAQIIQMLEKSGYFMYVEPALIDQVKKGTEAQLMQYGQVGYEEYDPQAQKYIGDCRYFGYGDAEELYEWGGFEYFFTRVRPTLEKMGVKLEQVVFPEEVGKNQLVVINGLSYILYDEADAQSWQSGWGVAVERFIDIANDVLKRQDQGEKLYDVPVGGVIFLTQALYQYLRGLDLDEAYKPRELPER